MRYDRIFWTVLYAFLSAVISTSPDYANASEETRQFERTIHSASELDYPPFSIIRDDGSADGFSVELLTAAANAVRLDVDFKVGPWSEIKADLINGRIDALPLVSYTEERDELMDFTASYLRMHGAVFVRKGENAIQNEADLRGAEIIVMRGDTAHEYITRKKLTDRIVLTDSYEEAMRLLSAGKHDAVVVQYLVGLQLIKKLGISNVTAVQSVREPSLKPSPEPLLGFEQKFCIAVREGDRELLSLLNEGLSLVIASGEYDQLYNKWFGPILPPPPVSLARMAKYTLFIVVPFIVLTLIFGVWLLRKQVAGKTRELKDQVAVSENAKQALEASETHLRTLINTLPDLIWLKDADGRFLGCNRRFENLYAATEQEIIGKTDYDFVDRELADFFRKNDQIAIDRGEPFKNEEEVVFADDGHHEILETIKTPMYGTDGELVGVLGIGRDITLRKQFEESLRSASERLKAVLDHSPLLIAEFDVDGRFLLANTTIARFHGIPQPELIGRKIDELFPAHVAEKLMERLTRVREAHAPLTAEFSLPQDETDCFFSTTLFPLFDSTGKILSIGVIAHDITQQKKATSALMESEERFRALHDASFGGIGIHDKGVILECNKGLSDITGFEYSELIGMDGLKLISDDTRDLVIQNINSGYEHPYEAKGIRKNGETYPLRLEARKIPYHGKQVRVVEFRDITESKLIEKEKEDLENKLRQAQKMEAVGRLAGGVAHDYNNMLSVIIGYTELAMENVQPSDPFHDHLKQIYKAARRSVDVTRQLLAFARKQTIAPQVTDLNAIVNSMLKMLVRLIGEDIEMIWLPADQLWPIFIDPAQVDQILANLCVNARDAITDGGKVTIETRNVTFDKAYARTHPDVLPGEHVLLTVSDDGSGMDKETASNIFEPFFTTKGLEEGTGLGLATVYGIVKQNNGLISVDSELDKGTTFKIYFPRYIGDDQQKKVPPAVQSLAGQGETILLVEDEPAIVDMAQKMLQRLGYSVLAAGTPGQAIDLAKKHSGSIDLLISDVVMPEMNGRELSNQIGTFCPELKTLFMSGYTANVIADHGVLEEGTNFIQKPFSSKDLGAKIRSLLDGEREDPRI